MTWKFVGITTKEKDSLHFCAGNLHKGDGYGYSQAYGYYDGGGFGGGDCSQSENDASKPEHEYTPVSRSAGGGYGNGEYCLFITGEGESLGEIDNYDPNNGDSSTYGNEEGDGQSLKYL